MQGSSADFSNPWIDDTYWPGPDEEEESPFASLKEIGTSASRAAISMDEFAKLLKDLDFRDPPFRELETKKDPFWVTSKSGFDRHGRKTR